jgi:single-strand DNA-binding protein
MLNRCEVIGRLGKDPEIHTTQSGKQVARLSVATSESWKDKNGNKQEKTEWHRVVIWGAMANVCENYLAQGSLVYLAGKIQTRDYEDKDGAKRYITELVANELKMLDSKKKSDKPEFGPEPNFDSEEEIPF